MLPEEPDKAHYFTYGHADMSFGAQRSELAKTLKIDGVVDDFSEGLKLIDSSHTIHGMVYVEAPGEAPTYVDDNFSNSETFIEPATWVVFAWEE